MFGKDGFSLVETITTAAIFCILSTFSFPGVLSLKTGMIMRGTVEKLICDFQYAKTEAIRSNSYVVVKISRRGYEIFLDDGAMGAGTLGDWVRQPGEKVLISRSLPGWISLKSNFNNDSIRFRGVAGVRPGSVIISGLKTSAYKVILSRAGRLRVKKD